MKTNCRKEHRSLSVFIAQLKKLEQLEPNRYNKDILEKWENIAFKHFLKDAGIDVI